MIEVGQILDKYELLEKVGQGGMAVVYRGIDRSLKRQVAVKVLHRHLAEHQEARDRFEREAQAVAKLRHENILEIFDFSGNDSDESYIVTEFIDGQTLKAFISDHAIKFPEVGAMITLQICRALSHAHGLGILHRDIKPENIMIRTDGVVKLTDFGIAQMIDLRRMTVTGQLLGSPAYMSPEHVEGRPLDFRTDVFSVGILIYQLVVGRLPFRGRNPHEILKRIAECIYDDPRKSNPRVGRELGGIIDRALAREPDDRFPDISEMLAALERYCDQSGLSDHTKELARFFEAPASYEMALKPRLLDTLSRRGRELADSDRVESLELFNRVLTIDPENEEVLQAISSLSRRQRGLRMAALFGGIVLVGAIGLGVKMLLTDDDPNPRSARASVILDAGAVDPPSPPDAAARIVAERTDAAVRVLVDAAVPDGAVKIARTPRIGKRPIKRPRNGDKPKKKPPDAGVAAKAPVSRSVTLVVSPRNSEYKLPGGGWTKIPGGRVTFAVPESVRSVQVRNLICCQTAPVQLAATGPLGTKNINLSFLPGSVTPMCSKPDIGVRIDKKRGRLGQRTDIQIRSLGGLQPVTVEFFHRLDFKKYFRSQTVRVRYKQDVKVSCPP